MPIRASGSGPGQALQLVIGQCNLGCQVTQRTLRVRNHVDDLDLLEWAGLQKLTDLMDVTTDRIEAWTEDDGMLVALGLEGCLTPPDQMSNGLLLGLMTGQGPGNFQAWWFGSDKGACSASRMNLSNCKVRSISLSWAAW